MNNLRIPLAGILFRIVSRPKELFPDVARNRVAVPIDFGAEVDRIEMKQPYFVPQKSFRLVNGSVNPVWKIPPDESRGLTRAAIKALRRRCGQILLEPRSIRRARIVHAEADALELRISFLRDPVREFTGTHGSQTLELFNDTAHFNPRHGSPPAHARSTLESMSSTSPG